MRDRRQFEVTNASCDMPAKVTVFTDKSGAVHLGLQPWATQVRFTPDQLSALVDHLSRLRTDQ